MKHGQSEIVVLKPTTVFLSFLASQLPEADLPSLKTLLADNTAYVISKHDSDDATLNEIQKHFKKMFRHEISRWLGDNARNKIESSFLDFLCCFKFELHSHIILMESSVEEGRQILIIKPRTLLLNWIKAELEDEDLDTVLERVTLSHITENASVMVKNFSKLNDIKPFLKQYYKPVFETVMSRMTSQRSQWPVVNSYLSFCKYFTVEVHTQLIHLQH
jgi:hypothetical protein